MTETQIEMQIETQKNMAQAQPLHFVFTPENLKLAEGIVAKYPEDRAQSAVLPLLDLAQRQAGNWLPRAAMDYVAGLLDMPVIRVYEIATFYTMFRLQPVGKYLIQMCRTTPCWLSGGDEIAAVCHEKLGIGFDQTTPDGLFTLVEVECLGACANAPVVQINDDLYEDLTPATMAHLLGELAAGRIPAAGSMTARAGASPCKKATCGASSCACRAGVSEEKNEA